MRRFDKTKNIFKANLLAEQRYLETKNETNNSLNTNIWETLYDSNLFCDKHEIELIFEITPNKFVEVLIDFRVKKEGEYRPARWGYHGGSEEEHPEAVLEINRISSNNYTLTDEDKENIINYHSKKILNQYLEKCNYDDEY